LVKIPLLYRISIGAYLSDTFLIIRLQFVRYNPSIGHFSSYSPFVCPIQPFYRTLFLFFTFRLSDTALLSDTFPLLRLPFVRYSPSIEHFSSSSSFVCPIQPFYRTLFLFFAFRLSDTALLSDTFPLLRLPFVRYSPSIGHFSSSSSFVCPIQPFYRTLFQDKPKKTGRIIIHIPPVFNITL
jgi:hypothetical protein